MPERIVGTGQFVLIKLRSEKRLTVCNFQEQVVKSSATVIRRLEQQLVTAEDRAEFAEDILKKHNIKF